MSASEKTIYPHLHQHAPSIQRFFLPRTFIAHPALHPYEASALKVRGKRNSWMPGHLLGVVTARWERIPQIPEPPPNTAPRLRSVGVVVVGLAASPATSAPIGLAALPAAGGKGRRQQTLPHHELASFLKFEMAILD